MAKPTRPRDFTTLPAAVIGDKSLTALDIRCLAAIAFHDGMSIPKKTGAGCYAKNTTLANAVGIDPTNFSKSLTKLLRAGYVIREPQPRDKRRFTLRVVYSENNSCRTDQLSDGQEAGEVNNDSSDLVGNPADYPSKVVGEGDGKNGNFSKQNDEHYISLNEELDFVETRELDPVKPRAADFQGFAGEASSDHDGALSGDVAGAWQDGERGGFSAPFESGAQILEDAGEGRSIGQVLAQYERLLKNRPERVSPSACYEILFRMWDEAKGDNALSGQLERLTQATYELMQQQQQRLRI